MVVGGIVVIGITYLAASQEGDVLKSAEEKALEKLSQPKEAKRKVEEHALALIKNLIANIQNNTQNFERRIHDQALLDELSTSTELCISHLRCLAVESITHTLEEFAPILKECKLPIDLTLQILYEELTQIINSIPSSPKNIHLLKAYTKVFGDFTASIEQIHGEFKGVQADIDRIRGTHETETLAKMVVALKVFSLFQGANEARLGMISEDISLLKQDIEEARVELSDEILRRVDYRKQKLLENLERSYSYSHQFFEGISSAWELLENSKLLNTENIHEEIEENHQYVKEEILPVCLQFCIPQREGVAGFRKYFDKLKRSPLGKPISIGLAESLIVYFDSRLHDAQMLTNSTIPSSSIEFLQKIGKGSTNKG